MQFEIDNMQAPIDFQGTDDQVRTLQNAKNLLMCQMGEVPYDRFRGFDTSLFDLPMEDFLEELMPELDRVMMWEPDVEVVEADASLLDDGTMLIRVTLSLDDDEDEEDEDEET